MAADLHEKTKVTIEQMSLQQALALLEEKWITPIVTDISNLPNDMLDKLMEKIFHLYNKYMHTFSDVGKKIYVKEKALSVFLKDLTADPLCFRWIKGAK